VAPHAVIPFSTGTCEFVCVAVAFETTEEEDALDELDEIDEIDDEEFER